MSRLSAKSKQDLQACDSIAKDDLKAIERVAKRYAVGISSHVQKTIKGGVQDDPIAKQYVPQLDELKILPEENIDPIGDDVHTPVKGIVHRYPDRVLYKPANVCAVYCRYCFRREMVGPGSDILSAPERKAAMDYIRNNPDIWEVILTGGDPLVLSPRHLNETISALNDIEHVQIVRFHSRVPIADPQRINPVVVQALASCEKAVYVVVHINHAREITDEVKATLQDLHKAGCVLLSQSVLLKGVNDDAKTLEELFRALTALRVKPYYLHHADLAPGTSHFRTSIEEGQNIMKQLRGNLSGISVPNYMLDIPGGFGKIPIEASYIRSECDHAYVFEDYKGQTHVYPPTKNTKDTK